MAPPPRLSLSTQVFPTSPSSQPTQSDTSSLSEGDLLSNALTDWLAQTHRAPAGQQNAYRSAAMAHFSQLRNQITFFKASLSSEERKLKIQELISEHGTALSRFYSGNVVYAEGQLGESSQNTTFTQRLEERVKSFGHYTIPQTPPGQPVDPVQFQAQEDFLGASMGVHFASETLATLGDGLLSIAKAACNTTPGTRQACKSTLQFAKESGKTLLEITGTKEIVKEAIAYWKSCDGSSLAEVLEKQHGFPKEQAEILAHYAAHDMKEIATAGAMWGGTSLAIKGAKLTINSAKGMWTGAKSATAGATETATTGTTATASTAAAAGTTETATASTTLTYPNLLTSRPPASASNPGNSGIPPKPPQAPPSHPTLDNSKPHVVEDLGVFSLRARKGIAKYNVSILSDRSIIACIQRFENIGEGTLLSDLIDSITRLSLIHKSPQLVLEVPNWNGRLQQVLERRYNYLGNTETNHLGKRLGSDGSFHQYEIAVDQPSTMTTHGGGGNAPPSAPKSSLPPVVKDLGQFGCRTTTRLSKYQLSMLSDGSMAAYIHTLQNSGGGSLLLRTIDMIKNLAKVDNAKRVVIEIPDTNGRLLGILGRRYNYLGKTETNHLGTSLEPNRFFHQYEITFDRLDLRTVAKVASSNAKPTATFSATKAQRIADARQAELTATLVNQYAEDYLFFPSMKKIMESDVADLHMQWSRNQRTLIGAIAEKGLPEFGYCGVDAVELKHITRTRSSHSRLGISIGASGLDHTMGELAYGVNPVKQLADMIAIGQTASSYLPKSGHGALLLINTKPFHFVAKAMTSHFKRLEGLDKAEQIRMLRLMQRDGRALLTAGGPGGKTVVSEEAFLNAGFYWVDFNSSNFKSIVLGSLAQNKTVYASWKKSVEAWSQLAERFVAQERVIRTFEKLNLVKDLSKIPWKDYYKSGSDIVRLPRESIAVPFETLLNPKSAPAAKQTPFLSRYGSSSQHAITPVKHRAITHHELGNFLTDIDLHGFVFVNDGDMFLRVVGVAGRENPLNPSDVVKGLVQYAESNQTKRLFVETNIHADFKLSELYRRHHPADFPKEPLMYPVDPEFGKWLNHNYPLVLERKYAENLSRNNEPLPIGNIFLDVHNRWVRTSRLFHIPLNNTPK